ncbi:hypothetical protein [Desulfobacter postgatei]|jgi:putative molybdopterin biosynthesis protein|nr:hypothetical protein [uncultured Desulfobacter sp.]
MRPQEIGLVAGFSPNFHAAAMDGVAVDAKSTFGASDEAPKSLTIGKTGFWVNTGQELFDSKTII